MKKPPKPSAVLKECLLEAGALIKRASAKEKRIDYKGRLSLVTETDKKSEKLIVGKILKAFPGHGILAEESGGRRPASPHRWIIDPLDGTTNFAHGFPVYCVTIAYEEHGKIMAGGVLDPTRDELFFAERGAGATLNGKPISVSKTPALSASLLCTGYPYDRCDLRRAKYYIGFKESFITRCHDVRRTGSAALDLCYVASGRFDGFWEYHLNPWDVAAAYLIIEEAGGKVTGYLGEPYRIDGKQTLASNGRIHGEMVHVLRGYMLKTKEPEDDAKEREEKIHGRHA
ncbi:MAG: inositol monophosphatase [Candidatus Omnitrophica bacterium]|nr:inositol monophosphatase [Candidatus Omnitrophota bacterium]